jgi:hypothetical protein
VPMFLRATNTNAQATDSKPVNVIVFNKGSAPKLTTAAKLLTIPIDFDPATMELDVKQHWTNPAGIVRIIGVLEWEQLTGTTPWNVELSVGSGECPDSGVTIGKGVTKTTSPILVDVRPTKPVTGMHFVHLKPVDGTSHKGEKINQAMKVYIFTE